MNNKDNKNNKTNNIHFIKAPFSSIKDANFEKSSEYVKEKYDYEIKEDLTKTTYSPVIRPALGYKLLYEYVKKHKLNNPKDIIVTIGGDQSLSVSTISAMNDLYKNLYVLWIDSYPDLHNILTSYEKSLNRMSLSSLLDLSEKIVDTPNKLNTNNVICLGLRDIDDFELESLNQNSITYFDMKRINKLGMKTVVDYVKEVIGNNPLHITFDLKAFDDKLVPSIYDKGKAEKKEKEKGLSVNDLDMICSSFRNNLVSIDVTEFSPSDNYKENHSTAEIARKCIIKCFDLKEKSLNIYNEDSYFLIYRPLSQKDPFADIGWYVLRGLDKENMNNILKHIPNDTIISIDVDGIDCLVTKTTINEQNNKEYYMAKTVNDVTLLPKEKLDMVFELINS